MSQMHERQETVIPHLCMCFDQYWMNILVLVRGVKSCRRVVLYQVGVQSYKKYADTNPTRDTNGLKKLNPNTTCHDTDRHEHDPY